jgi:hypothetical protein
MNRTETEADISPVLSTDGLEVVGYRPPPTKTVIAARLRMLADDMEYLAACMDYYGGFAEWSKHGREIAGAGAIARQWAAEIETSNAGSNGPSGIAAKVRVD